MIAYLRSTGHHAWGEQKVDWFGNQYTEARMEATDARPIAEEMMKANVERVSVTIGQAILFLFIRPTRL